MVLSFHMKDTSNLEDAVNHALLRGVANIYPNVSFIKEQLLSGKKLKIYMGIDPTGPTLHLGHAIPLMKLRQFQDLGHKIILLMGDFTATIGDPTDKAATRKQLTRKEVLANMKLYKSQASKLLSFAGKNAAEIRFNSKWLSKMNFESLINLASNITYAQLIKRDMFQKRIEAGADISLHEFLYPLMQGYDSVAMEVDGEIGGNDQTFNMLVGRDLEKKLLNKEKFVIASKLLTDNGGKKMGKTEGNMVALSDSAEDMFGKIMSWTDSMIVPGFELCTNISFEAVKTIERELTSDVHPMEYKKRLAREIVAIYHGEKKAIAAEDHWTQTFSEGKAHEGKKIHLTIKAPLMDLLVEHGFAASKSDFRRLIQEGAIKVIVKQEEKKIIDPNTLIEDSTHLKIGKKKFVTITFRKKR